MHILQFISRGKKERKKKGDLQSLWGKSRACIISHYRTLMRIDRVPFNSKDKHQMLLYSATPSPPPKAAQTTLMLGEKKKRKKKENPFHFSSYHQRCHMFCFPAFTNVTEMACQSHKRYISSTARWSADYPWMSCLISGKFVSKNGINETWMLKNGH